MKIINYSLLNAIKEYNIKPKRKESYIIGDTILIQFDINTIKIGTISEIKNIGAKELFKTETTVLFPTVWHIDNPPQEFLDKYCDKIIVNKSLCFRANKQAF